MAKESTEDRKSVVGGLSIKQLVMYVILSGGVGAGGIYGIPFFQQQLDRIDIVIYLMCDQNQDCVESSWKHIVEIKAIKAAQGGVQ